MVVVGFGSCGIELLNHGSLLKNKKIAIIEEKKEGGTCLNTGCIPSKYWLRAAYIYRHLPSYTKYGIKGNYSINFEELKTNMLNFISSIRQKLKQKAQALGIDILQGKAMLIDEHTLEVNGKLIKFDHMIIASGSSPIELPHIKFGEQVLSTDTFWTSIEKNDTLFIIGAGAIGVEVSFMLEPFSIVKGIADLAPEILATFNLPKNVKELISAKLSAMKIKLELSSSITSFSNNKVELSNGKIYDNINKLLVVVGRKPNTSWLNNIIELTNKGYVHVNHNYQTSLNHIYACGDVIGSNMAHAAMYQMKNIIRHITTKEKQTQHACYPQVIYSDPQIAWCGKLEAEEIRTIKFLHNPTSYLYEVGEECFANLYLQKGKVKGILIVHPYASELIHIFMPYINQQREWKNEYFIHPSMSFSFRGFNL